LVFVANAAQAANIVEAYDRGGLDEASKVATGLDMAYSMLDEAGEIVRQSVPAIVDSATAGGVSALQRNNDRTRHVMGMLGP
jgi:hypothetical protein